MKFKLEANTVFKADNINDAFLKLAHHFLKLYNKNESNLLINGEIKISPFEEVREDIIKEKI